MIRTLVVDETPLLADLKAVALRNEPDIEVVGCVCTVGEALKLCQQIACDVILASVTLPDKGVLELTRTVRKNDMAIKVLLTGMVDSKTVILTYLEHGVAGYVLMEDSWAELVQKIRATSRNECMVSAEVAAAMVARLCELKQSISQLGSYEVDAVTLYASLTEREGEILGLIEQGYTNLQIGATLCIELGTVKNHVHNLLDKLGVPSRSQAALVARQARVARADQFDKQSESAFLTPFSTRTTAARERKSLYGDMY